MIVISLDEDEDYELALDEDEDYEPVKMLHVFVTSMLHLWVQRFKFQQK